jgi:hypothetical protein
MTQPLKPIGNMPKDVQDLLYLLYHEFYQQIEMNDFEREILVRKGKYKTSQNKSIEDWEQLREKITFFLTQANYDAEAFAKALQVQEDLKLGLLFLCPSCSEPHKAETHCFDCNRCQQHCDCPQWQFEKTEKQKD